jgi:hypothetical protein
MANTKIHYLSVEPGVGKTKWAVLEMARRIEEQEDGLTYYVAPTVSLIDETYHHLVKKVLVENPEKWIRRASSKGSLSHITVARQIDLFINGGVYEGVTYNKSKPGTVILMTHEAFINLPANFKKDNVSVIFDEARKFMAKMRPVHLTNPKENRHFSKILKANSKPLLNAEGKPTAFRRFFLDMSPSKFLALLSSSNGKEQFTNIKTLLEAARNPDVDVYVLNATAKQPNAFYKVIIPSRVFQGFKEVILMAAYLEDSQMWHFLKGARGFTLINLLHQGPYQAQIIDLLETRIEQIDRRFAAVTILPLTLQNRLLSMTRLGTGIMVPEAKMLSLKVKLESLKVTKTKRLISLLDPSHGTVVTPPEQEALDLLHKYKVTTGPFAWYCNMAALVIAQLKKQGKLVGKPLAACNNDFKDILDNDYPVFHRISTNSHGQNKYMRSNTLFFTAAINPSNSDAALYKALLPDYNYANDYVADACVQCVTRLSVRDVNCKDKVYVILPDMALSKLLLAKLKDRPSLNPYVATRLGMTSFSRLSTTVERKARLTPTELVTNKKDSYTKWKKSNQELARLNPRKTYYTKQIAAGIRVEKNTARLAEVVATLAQLKKHKNRL